ncbi:NYN domain-containing protein [Microbulbifer sp. SA54]|uniref:NYN domain-containing protein n=1 Tax=Microbulbifer sp. SA54 TaxID=3401577 RepID=UPI003AAA6AD0
MALFIDADNAPAGKFEDVLSEVPKYGEVTIRKAYGNWKSPSLKIIGVKSNFWRSNTQHKDEPIASLYRLPATLSSH